MPFLSKLIHVSHATYTDHGPSSEYHRLFRERFPPTNTTTSQSNPSADPEVAETEEDEATWLASIIGNASSSSNSNNNNDVEGSWERVEPIESGALTIQFGDALGLDRKR